MRRERTDLRRNSQRVNWSYQALTLFPSDVALCEVAATIVVEPGAEEGGEEESREETKEEMNPHSLNQL